MRRTEHAAGDGISARKRVILVGEGTGWLDELEPALEAEGFSTARASRLDAVLPTLAGGAVQALFLAAGPLAASDLLVLRRIREEAPSTAVVVVTRTPTDPDLKRAFESGATAFLSWPSSNDAVRHAIDRGSLPGVGGNRT